MGDQTSFSLSLCGFLLISLLSKEAASASSCRRGWLVYQGFCYGFFKDRKTWADAEADCQSMGAHLASIHGAAESSKVAEYVSAYNRGNKNVWIGMHFDTGRKRWMWVDRTKIIFLGGKVGEPKNFNLFGPEECVQLVSEQGFQRWIDARCAKTRPYLCKHMNISV